ncbi:ATP-binding response regulator [Thioflexithrix psekupsensis]|uniref:histidine kinase n=1 Tax=Thioflexithrix psekupsensis TaxID=1570016 RepID=A0A251X7K3_9GAMM|nr:hybrid sensor histidine kinase/response regulator [Thioflexithrix psekupsensis]OUD13310.1 hybrid sensor histidine kinase/response regulator [Thioflexithrix psekupsensis]
MNPEHKQGTLLIVDDTPANISVLFDFLTDEGFKVLVAKNGKGAIQKAGHAHPDLILLDIMMPEMDGFEACQRLKEAQDTKDIPVIFMTALADTVDKVKGFSLGAVDYITKPFQHDEVLARIHTHLQVRRLQTELEQRSKELEQRNIELDAFARTVAHDLKNPLNVIMGYTEMLLLELSPHEPPKPDVLETVAQVGQASQKMLSIIDALLLLSGVAQRDKVPMSPLDMTDIIHTSLSERLASMIDRHQVKVNLPETWPDASGYAPWVEEVWVNYLSNAIKYGGQPPEVTLGAEVIEQESMVRFWVRDNGAGLSPEACAQLFTPFTRLNQQGGIEGHGLGLSIVRQIIDKLHGQTGIESQEGQGSLFYFTLPAVMKVI